MPCFYGDKPLRVKLSKTGVVHAGSYQDYGGYYKHRWDQTGRSSSREYIPKSKRVTIVCRWRKLPENLEDYLVSNSHEITCKSCQKLMGLDNKPLSPERFVVRHKDTGEFMKNTRTRCSGWSESLTDAFFFKRRHTARDKCKVHRYRVGNKLLTYKEWIALDRPPFNHASIYDPNLEVKKVKITLED